ncbi:MAG: hypothetical protein JXB46_09030 [Candidatus Eisenbacteria bacterium]|nr:hypothetical protein [Candidatus Eisenbacteria bacterium]
MFGFLIKKAFFDMWDNLFRVVILNLGFLLCFGLVLLVPNALSFNVPLSLASLFVSLVVLMLFTGGASHIAKEISDYGTPGFRDFWFAVKRTWLSSVLFAVIVALHVFILSYAIPFYGAMESFVGPIAVAFIFWISVIWAVACVYFFPVQSRLDTNIRKIIRKMLLLLFDNTLFTLGLLIGAVATFVLSGFTAFLLPGITAILVWLNVALKLRLYKYDYLEEHPDANRRRIPWDVLLIDDRERVGKRTLRGMIFPWKE